MTPANVAKAARKWGKEHSESASREVRYAAKCVLQMAVLVELLQSRVDDFERAAGPGPFDALADDYDSDRVEPERSGVFDRSDVT